MRQSCFGGFDVVAQRRLWLASPLEMGGELSSGNGGCRAALSFQGDGDLAVKLRARGGCGPLVQDLAEQRVPEGIRDVRRSFGLLDAGGVQPYLLAREVVAGLRDRDGIALQCVGDRIDVEFDAAHGRRRKDQVLIVR